MHLDLVRYHFLKIFSYSKKIVIILFVFATIFSIFSVTISKNRPSYDPSYITKESRKQLYQFFNNPELQKSPGNKILAKLYRAQVCVFSGEACTDNPDDGDKNVKTSIIGHISNLMVIPYTNPPASGIYWAYSGLQNAGFIPKSYAAEGIGFGSLKPLMNMWKIFRDIAYLLLVLVLVSIGFMIMFRMKINPQTIISVENALPKIATTLILITFSFAIAGFIIDLMYVLIAVAISILSNNNAFYDTAIMQNFYLNAKPEDLYTSMLPIERGSTGIAGAWLPLGNITMIGNAVMSLLPAVLNNIIRAAGTIGMAFIVIKDIAGMYGVVKSGVEIFNNIDVDIAGFGISPGQIWGGIISPLGGMFVATIVFMWLALYGMGLVIGLLVYLTIIFLVFRIFFLLFRAYLQILFLVMTAPIILLIEAVPGKSTFSMWFKNLFAEVLTFPLVVVIFLIGNVMVNSLAYPGDFWFPPFLMNIDPLGFSLVIGMGFIFIIPDFVKMMKEALGAKGLPISVGLGTLFGGAGAGVGGGLSILGQFSTMSMGLSAITGKTFGQMIGTAKLPAPEIQRGPGPHEDKK